MNPLNNSRKKENILSVLLYINKIVLFLIYLHTIFCGSIVQRDWTKNPPYTQNKSLADAYDIKRNEIVCNDYSTVYTDYVFCFDWRDNMFEKIIEPWDLEEQEHEFYVPEYIEEIAEKVLQYYHFSVYNRQIVTTKSDKGGAIWKIETSEGPKSLKLLHRRPTRSLFSLGAQEYLVNVQNAKVPAIIKTKDGALSVECGGKLWFVAEWIEHLAPVSKDLDGAKHLCYALGEFHRLSKGYKPPQSAEIASRLHKWPRSYQKTIEKMDWLRNIAKAYPEMPASPLLLNELTYFEQQASNSYKQLVQSSYSQLVSKGNEYWGLVHQDYGWSNGQMGENGMWVIDLDGVAYDLPIRDLRKLISGTMADISEWNATWIREMISAYHQANPISTQVYEVLMIDLSLPNEFYKNLKEAIFEPEFFLNDQAAQLIQTIVEVDQTKWPVLDELKNNWIGSESQ